MSYKDAFLFSGLLGLAIAIVLLAKLLTIG